MKIAHYEQMMDYLTGPRERFRNGGKPGDLVTIGNKKYTKERLEELNKAAKKRGYTDFQSVPVGKERDNVARDATRRSKGVAEGKGRPGVKKDYQVKTGEKDLASEAYLQRDLKRTKNQSNILKAVQSGKYKTAGEIMKAVKLENNVFNKEVNNLFKNVYSQIGDLNKPKKSQARFGVRFLPKDLDKMYKIRNELGQISGFESIEQRNIYAQIADAYGQKGEMPNRKAFEIATKKASDFSKIKNEIKKKYPNINLELDHPLDYKTIEGLGKKGEKFLHVTPIDKSINRGFKETLGKAYATAVKDKDRSRILKIENLANDIGVTVGKVRGSKVMDYGTTTLRESDLGKEIITNLKQQNVIADNIKKLESSGELKTRLKDIGLPRAGEKPFKISKVSEDELKNILAIVGCGNADGGRIEFQTGATPTAQCIARGAEKINTGNIKAGAEARNASQFLNRAYKVGRGILKFGVIPEAIFVTGESLVRMGMGDTLNESLLRATDYLLPGNQSKTADKQKLVRTVGEVNADTVMRANDYKQAQQNLKDTIAKRDQNQMILDDSEFGYTSTINSRDQLALDEQKIKKAQADLKAKFQPEAVMDFATMKEAESSDIAKSKSFFPKFIQKARNAEIDSIETLAAPEKKQKSAAAPMFTIDDLAGIAISDDMLQSAKDKLGGAPEYTKRNMLDFLRQTNEGYNNAVIEAMFAEGRGSLANRERLFGTSGSFGGQPIKQKPMYDFAGGGIAKIAGKSSGPPPESGPLPQGLDFLIKRGRQS
tara:strand:+ start:33 stop:2342 length:2310 start_codon:yes stop_codon:yes gene_type:complete